MIWILLLAAVYGIWYVLSKSSRASQSAKSLFDGADRYYEEVQNRLREKILDSDKPVILEEIKAFERAQLDYHELWRKHVAKVLAMDTVTQHSKYHVVESWYDYLQGENSVTRAIEIGYFDPDNDMDRRDLAMNKFEGVMEAYGFDIRKELKDANSKYMKEMNLIKKPKKKVRK